MYIFLKNKENKQKKSSFKKTIKQVNSHFLFVMKIIGLFYILTGITIFIAAKHNKWTNEHDRIKNGSNFNIEKIEV